MPISHLQGDDGLIKWRETDDLSKTTTLTPLQENNKILLDYANDYWYYALLLKLILNDTGKENLLFDVW